MPTTYQTQQNCIRLPPIIPPRYPKIKPTYMPSSPPCTIDIDTTFSERTLTEHTRNPSVKNRTVLSPLHSKSQKAIHKVKETTPSNIERTSSDVKKNEMKKKKETKKKINNLFPMSKYSFQMKLPMTMARIGWVTCNNKFKIEEEDSDELKRTKTGMEQILYVIKHEESMKEYIPFSWEEFEKLYKYFRYETYLNAKFELKIKKEEKNVVQRRKKKNNGKEMMRRKFMLFFYHLLLET